MRWVSSVVVGALVAVAGACSSDESSTSGRGGDAGAAGSESVTDGGTGGIAGQCLDELEDCGGGGECCPGLACVLGLSWSSYECRILCDALEDCPDYCCMSHGPGDPEVCWAFSDCM